METAATIFWNSLFAFFIGCSILYMFWDELNDKYQNVGSTIGWLTTAALAVAGVSGGIWIRLFWYGQVAHEVGKNLF